MGPYRRPSPTLVAGLEQTGCSLAATDAHGDDAVFALAALELVGDGADHARAGHAERMPDRDRPAVRVQLVHGDAERVAAVDDLGGEGLVQLPHVDIFHLEPGALQELRHRVDWPDPHLVALAPGDGEAAED